jgi:glutathione S-transferase
MITLYGFKSMWGLPDISMFVAKVDMYLRMAGIRYVLQPYPFFELGKAPKGKLPFIEDNGKRVPDSSFILEYLKATYGDTVDDHLSPQEQAIAQGMKRMMEENLYWVIIQIRWRIDENWQSFMAQFFRDFEDKAMLDAVLPKVREAVLQEMWGHGMMRHSVDEVWHIGKTDVTAMADFLADKPYFLGDRPSSLDAVAYATLGGLQGGFDTPMRQHIQAHANLVAYCKRIQERYYAE